MERLTNEQVKELLIKDFNEIALIVFEKYETLMNTTKQFGTDELAPDNYEVRVPLKKYKTEIGYESDVVCDDLIFTGRFNYET